VYIFTPDQYQDHVTAHKKRFRYYADLVVVYNDGHPIPTWLRTCSPVVARSCIICSPNNTDPTLKRKAVNNVFRMLRAKAPNLSESDLRRMCAVSTYPRAVQQESKVVIIAHNATPDHPSFSFRSGLTSCAVPATLKDKDSCMACLDPIDADSACPAYQCTHCMSLLCGACLKHYFQVRGEQHMCFSGREKCPRGAGALVGAGLPSSMPITDMVQELTRFLTKHKAARAAVVYNDSNPAVAQALRAAENNIAPFMMYSLNMPPGLDGLVALVKLSELPHQMLHATCTVACCVDVPIEVAQSLCTLPRFREVLHLFPAASVRAMSAAEAAHAFGSDQADAARQFACALEPLESPVVPTFPVRVSDVANLPELTNLQPRPLMFTQGIRIAP